MKPNDVNSKNEQLLRDSVYNYKRLVGPPPSSIDKALIGSRSGVSELRKRWEAKRAAFKVGDPVRLSKYKTVFEKGYTPNWTSEIFTIDKIQYNTNPITYLLKDYQDNEVKGSVYAEELQLVKNKDIYLIEKVLRTNKNQVYVKWLGFGDEHNSWIPKNQLIK